MAGKMSPLESRLIVRKGYAAPAAQRESTSDQGVPIQLTQSVPRPIGRPRRAGTIAITVRLDPDRYERLKTLGVNQGLTNQEIMVAALDAWLATQVGA
jgi:hypothetical protein